MGNGSAKATGRASTFASITLVLRASLSPFFRFVLPCASAAFLLPSAHSQNFLDRCCWALLLTVHRWTGCACTMHSELSQDLCYLM